MKAPVFSHSLGVVLARTQQRLGKPGAIGSVLIALALAMLAGAWRNHQPTPADVAGAPVSNAAGARPVSPATMPVLSGVLPSAAEVPRLLSRIERTAAASDLGWPRADYRFNAATDDMPASVEVSSNLKGTYLQVRRFTAALLQDTPTLTLKEFSLTRTGVDSVDLEAKLTMVIYFAGNSASVSEARE